MSEMLVSGRRVEDGEIAAGEGENVGWEGLAEVEFQGDRVEEQEVVDKTARLRGWIDLGGIASREDPEGLAAAEHESEARRGRVEEYKATLAEKDGRYAEIEARRAAIPVELATAAREMEALDRERMRGGVVRGLKRVLGIGAKERAELTTRYRELAEEQDRLWQEGREVDRERANLEQVIAETDIDGPRREFLEKFETPLTPEEKKEGLDFGALAELSTDEYLRLWRRLNPFFVTHVTRQGIRDHNAMIYHSAGMGEFHEGMTGVLADDKILRTPAEVRSGLEREVTEENVEKALETMLFSKDVDIEGMRARGMSDQAIADELVDNLPVNATIGAAEPWADKRAVHFAQLTVLDDHYGGESGNEAFFVFPTDVIASQCRFGGHTRGNLTSAETTFERKWNDLFVWPKEKDITIDAGLTFLPKNTLVDAETGSEYATKMAEADGRAVRVPEVDEEAIAKFTEWVSGLKPEDESVRKATGEGGRYDMGLLREEAVKAGVSERILDSVLKVSGEFPYKLQSFVNGGELGEMWLVPQAELEKMTPEERRTRSIREYLDGDSATWKLAENAVPAQEYWEKYFQEHPEQRPAHVIYYDGDPSAAVVSTLKEAGILEKVPSYDQRLYKGQIFTGRGDSSERDGGWLGFEENVVKDEATDEALQQEHATFNEMARKIVAEHYGLVI